MIIGDVQIPGKLILAPMAGVTDLAFRQICREHGAALSVSEMVSTRALLFQDKKSKKLLKRAPGEMPFSVQIFGHDPETMAQGAKLAAEYSGCEILDINMGCPAPKIVGNGDGSALMRDIELARSIISRVKEAVDIPVTVKFRKGWDEGHVNCLEFALMAQDAGADAICVHGRTRSQQYSGAADWSSIAAVKAAVKIPVIANGDVTSAQDVLSILEKTGADGVMIGRGSLGNPFIFEQGNAALAGKAEKPAPGYAERSATAVRQIELAAQDKGEHIAMLEARKHVGWYVKGISSIRDFKVQISALSTMKELYVLADALVQYLDERRSV